MKTKLFLIAMLFAQISFGQINVLVDTVVDARTYRFCGTSGAMVNLFTNNCPTNKWTLPGGQTITNTASLIVTSTNQGEFGFKCGIGSTKWFYIYFDSLPVKPSTFHDYIYCTTSLSLILSAQNAGATYHWNVGYTGSDIQLTTFGTYWVDITTACGTRTDTVHITYNNPDRPNLGPDQLVCEGTNVHLDPHVANASSYLWYNGATTSTITTDTAGTFSVRVNNTNGCNGKDTITVTYQNTPMQEIQVVTINTDPANPRYGDNKIVWDPTLNPTTTNVEILREAATDTYVPVGTVPYGNGEFTDDVHSEVHFWRYKIILEGPPCGYSDTSKFVQSIHSWVYPIMGGFAIQWDPYLTGNKSVSLYRIYKGNSLNQLIKIDSVVGNVTNYTIPTITDSIFVIGAVTGNKSTNVIALSNKVMNPLITGIQKLDYKSISIYNTPQNQLMISGDVTNNFEISIYNLLGQHFLTEKNKKEIDISSLPNGVYMVHVLYNGKQTIKKIVKL
jgi:hypothetical protein